MRTFPLPSPAPTNISQDFNRLLGDRTGRSVSGTIGDGIRKILPGLTHEQGKDVAHALMAVAGVDSLGAKKSKVTEPIALGLLFAYALGR